MTYVKTQMDIDPKHGYFSLIIRTEKMTHDSFRMFL